MEGVEIADRLAALWVKNRPAMLDRLAVLERASAALGAGVLTAELRVDAAGMAHKLAGSLGMFGFTEGTRVARELEVLLEGEAALEAGVVAGLVGELRAKVFG